MGEWTDGWMKEGRIYGRVDGRKDRGESRGQRGTQKKTATWVCSCRSRKLTSLLYLDFSLGMCGIYLHFPYTPTRTGIWTWEQIYLGTRCGPEGPGFDYRRRRDFTHPSRLALVPTQAPVQWVPRLLPEAWCGPPNTSCAEVK